MNEKFQYHDQTLNNTQHENNSTSNRPTQSSQFLHTSKASKPSGVGNRTTWITQITMQQAAINQHKNKARYLLHATSDKSSLLLVLKGCSIWLQHWNDHTHWIIWQCNLYAPWNSVFIHKGPFIICGLGDDDFQLNHAAKKNLQPYNILKSQSGVPSVQNYPPSKVWCD